MIKLRLLTAGFFSAIIFLFAFSVVTAHGATSQTQFPITINGKDCNDKAECRVICDDPVNTAACNALNPNPEARIDHFADPAFVQAARNSLGCSTAQTCKAVCSLKMNFDKCHEFAQEHQIHGGYDKRVLAMGLEESQGDEEAVEDPDIELLKEIKAQLVDSEQTLADFCDQAVNHNVCSVLAKKIGLRGGTKLKGPGGCQSADTCRAYCDDPAHFAECKKFEIAGLNNCTSELACYNELQSHPETLTNLLTEKTADGQVEFQPSSEDLTQLTQACSSVLTQYEGKTTSELATDMNRSDVCQVLPKSGVPGKNSDCDAYLASGQPFSQETFEKICEVKPVVVSQRLSRDLNSYQDWCKALPSVGQSSGDWQVVPTLCQNFVSTFQQAREACVLPEADRPTWLQDSMAYSRYCLSAPTDKNDYIVSCALSSTECKQGGFDWYCQQEGKTCVPLYQGRPIDQSVETFASAGLIKDGNKVSLVLDENTQNFAKGALAQTLKQTGVRSQFEVVSELPPTVSKDAVFVSGTGVRKFQPPSIDPRVQPFAQPWFLLDSRQQTNLSPIPTRVIDKRRPVTGWNAVKQDEQELRRKYLEGKQDVSGKQPLSPSLVRPTEFNRLPGPTTNTGTDSQVKTEPTRLPTKYPTTAPNTTYKSPTPVSKSSSEPTQPTTFVPTSQPTTTINTGTGTNTGGTFAPPPSPSVQGTETQVSIFGIVWQNILNIFK